MMSNRLTRADLSEPNGLAQTRYAHVFLYSFFHVKIRQTKSLIKKSPQHSDPSQVTGICQNNVGPGASLYLVLI